MEKYPGLRRESTAISDAVDSIGGAITGAGVGVAAWGLKKSAAVGMWGLKKTGQASMAAARLTGTAAYKGAGAVGKLAWSSLNSSNPLYNPIGVAAKTAYNIGKSMVKYTPGERVYNTSRKAIVKKAPTMRLTRFGGGVVLGGSVLSGIASAASAYEQAAMGAVDTTPTSATPEYKPEEYTRHISPPDFGGATGDLVFALNANRRGGSML